MLKNISKYKIKWYLISSLCILYVWSEFSVPILEWFDKIILPWISLFVSNGLSIAILLILCACVALDLWKKIQNNYQYNGVSVFCLVWSIIIIVYCRFINRYIYVDFLGSIKYVDVLCFLGGCYVISALINFIHYKIIVYQRKKENIDESGILHDWPITEEDEDIFDLKDEAQKIAKKIKKLDSRKTWSLAITAPWGVGKTSFLNLIECKLDKKDFEIIKFNPRDSKSYKSIQEDFFALLDSKLVKYDNRCSNCMPDYMASLRLIDNRGFLEKILNIYRIWDKMSLKDKIKRVFAGLNKKVIVLIDDFDRLSKEEILEVLKLLDCNAAFTNLVFLTAFDKKQVNCSLGRENQTDEAFFVDKFFNWEFFIPSRPYVYIRKYLIDNIIRILNAKDSEEKEIRDSINKRSNFIQTYLPTLRDAKRYINQVVSDYEIVRGDVNIEEYFLLHLIKYKYPDEYNKLYRYEFIQCGSIFSDTNMLYLKENLSNDLPVLPILKCLFPSIKEKREDKYRHIFEKQSFNNYFVNQIYAALRIRDMAKVFDGDVDTAYSKIDAWLTEDAATKDLVDYLSSFDMDDLGNSDAYLRYVDIVSYVAVHKSDSYAYWLFRRLIHMSNLVGYDRRYNLNTDNYKVRLLKIISDKKYDKLLPLLRKLHVGYKTEKINEDENIIKDEDIWPVVKTQFKEILEDNIVPEEEKLKYLYDCIDHMETSSRLIIIDTDCCRLYREHIEETPEFYMNNFVRLYGMSSDPQWNSVTCEPFCNEIFGGWDNVKKYIDKCLKDGINGADTAGKFWRLYAANSYKPIEFHDQGIVQEKIDNGFEKELPMLEHLQQIQTKLSEIPNDTAELDDKQKEKWRNCLEQMLKELGNIQLYISLNAQLRSNIEELSKRYSE